MPGRWIEIDPEIFVKHGGVYIYHTYKDDDIDSPSYFWYSTNWEDTDYDNDAGYQFDVRNLPYFGSRAVSPSGAEMREAMVWAIEQGLLKQDEKVDFTRRY